ncbi:MAG TPA: sigma-70 family RNA polymerase sigma factor [Bacteroidales bacterium]|nr:sigma-70 family RNA polymerase sigma factor [Bacteroidales bacterium]
MTTGYLDTGDLIRSCVRNDTDARKELYERFAPKMLSICHRYAKTKIDAEDIFQEGFLKVFENLKQIKKNESIEWWMKKVFVNEALKLYKRRKNLYLVDDLSVLDSSVPANTDLLNKLSTMEITHLIQKLPDKMRIVFNMYAIDGFSHKEISLMLNISIGTSKSNLHDARKTLQKKILKLEQIKLIR